jgi:hypothetical protein
MRRKDSAARKLERFAFLRKSLVAAGLSTDRAESLICPLCWLETPYDQLTLDHTVPRKVGGTLETLTCVNCNNNQGSDLDSNLVQYQKVTDALQGHGTLRTRLDINGHELIANLEWGEKSKNFYVVEKATNPAACAGSRQEIVSGKVSAFNFTTFLGYSRDNFNRAVVRAAYLVLFQRFGYGYARHDTVQMIRRRIADPSLQHPQLGSLVLEARNFSAPCVSQHFFVNGNVNGVGFFLVFIRVRRKTTTYLGAYLPLPERRDGEFFDLMEQFTKANDRKTLTFPAESIFI